MSDNLRPERWNRGKMIERIASRTGRKAAREPAPGSAPGTTPRRGTPARAVSDFLPSALPTTSAGREQYRESNKQLMEVIGSLTWSAMQDAKHGPGAEYRDEFAYLWGVRGVIAWAMGESQAVSGQDVPCTDSAVIREVNWAVALQRASVQERSRALGVIHACRWLLGAPECPVSVNTGHSPYYPRWT